MIEYKLDQFLLLHLALGSRHLGRAQVGQQGRNVDAQQAARPAWPRNVSHVHLRKSNGGFSVRNHCVTLLFFICIFNIWAGDSGRTESVWKRRRHVIFVTILASTLFSELLPAYRYSYPSPLFKFNLSLSASLPCYRLSSSQTKSL